VHAYNGRNMMLFWSGCPLENKIKGIVIAKKEKINKHQIY
jgi:hypothetical protein